MLTYELLDTKLLADEGTISPVVLKGPFPMVIIPTQSLSIRAEKGIYRIGKGQFVLLLHLFTASHLLVTGWQTGEG
ncbi:hypothetical protein [Lysinibacillus fusiformis]|uniref:hypothetical protein n=1 Tax=Lysinibacillus fusiformis TaxID=28031 RepID=UPI0011AA4C30|nr:hypothetical protein [Lysinibacillus fusiformis]